MMRGWNERPDFRTTVEKKPREGHSTYGYICLGLLLLWLIQLDISRKEFHPKHKGETSWNHKRQ